MRSQFLQSPRLNVLGRGGRGGAPVADPNLIPPGTFNSSVWSPPSGGTVTDENGAVRIDFASTFSSATIPDLGALIGTVEVGVDYVLSFDIQVASAYVQSASNAATPSALTITATPDFVTRSYDLIFSGGSAYFTVKSLNVVPATAWIKNFAIRLADTSLPVVPGFTLFVPADADYIAFADGDALYVQEA